MSTNRAGRLVGSSAEASPALAPSPFQLRACSRSQRRRDVTRLQEVRGHTLGCRGRGCARDGLLQSSSRNLSPNIFSMDLSIFDAFFAGLSETVSVATPRQTSFLVSASKR